MEGVQKAGATSAVATAIGDALGSAEAKALTCAKFMGNTGTVVQEGTTQALSTATSTPSPCETAQKNSCN